MTPLSEAELFDRARGGDRASFDHLFERCRPRLETGLRLKFPVSQRRGIDPEDVVQETALRAFRKLRSVEWRGFASFQRWVLTIGERLLVDHVRRSKRSVEGVQVPGPGDVIESVEERSQVSPERALRRHERMLRLERAVEQLSQDHRDVIRLAFIHETPIREIADSWGRTPRAIANLIARALEKLRGSFGDTDSLGLPSGARDEDSTPRDGLVGASP